jgi:hypothetical protein
MPRCKNCKEKFEAKHEIDKLRSELNIKKEGL